MGGGGGIHEAEMPMQEHLLKPGGGHIRGILQY